MPSWFNKVFKTDDKASATQPSKTQPTRSYSLRPSSPATSAASGDSQSAPSSGPPKARRVVEPTIVLDESPVAPDSQIRIKGQIDKDGGGCLFMIDRPVLNGHSAWFPMPQAATESPLAQAIFAVDGADSVLIHGMNISVERNPMHRENWEDWAKAIGARIRAHLEAGEPVVSEAFLASLPSETEIRDKIQRVIETEINPGIASHSGAISLERIEGNTVYIRMMGGCQGCAASTITLRQGIHQAFREAVPQLGAILDQTDHAAGTNPFYRSLPTGMNANA